MTQNLGSFGLLDRIQYGLRHPVQVWKSPDLRAMQLYNRELAELEKIPCRLGAISQPDLGLNEKQRGWIQRVKSEMDKLKKRAAPKPSYPHTPFSSEERAEFQKLQEQMLSLHLRLGETEVLGKLLSPRKSAEEEMGPEELKQAFVEHVVKRYKNLHALYPQDEERRENRLPGDWRLSAQDLQRGEELTEYDKRQIDLICDKYPQFVSFLLQRNVPKEHRKKNDNPASEREKRYPPIDSYTASFIKWAFRDGCSADVFIEFPNEAKLASKAFLDKRSGAVHGTEGLCVITRTDQKKTVAIRMYGSVVEDESYVPLPKEGFVEVLNKERKVKLKNAIDEYLRRPAKQKAAPYELPIGDIYRQFSLKTTSYQRVDYTNEGIINWNSSRLGSYNPETNRYRMVDLSAENWFEQLPVTKILTQEELKARYPGQKAFTAGQMGFAIRATRSKTNFDIAENHAHLEIITPNPDGTFNLRPYGLQPMKLPQGTWDKIKTLCDTQIAHAHYPDESFYLGQRQQIGYSFHCAKEEMEEFFAHLKKDLEKAKKGAKIFQAQANNCANFVQKMFFKTFVEKQLIDPLCEIFGKDKDPAFKTDLVGAFKSFNEEKWKKLLRENLEELPKQRLEWVLTHCCNLLEKTFFKDTPRQEWDLRDNAIPASVSELLDQKTLEELRESVRNLLESTLENQQFFKMYLGDAELKGPLLGPLLNGLKKLPSRKLRNFLISFIEAVLLLACRFKIIKTKEGKTAYKGLLFSKFFAGHTFNLPSGIFKWKATRAKESDKIRGYLAAARSRLAHLETLQDRRAGVSAPSPLMQGGET